MGEHIIYEILMPSRRLKVVSLLKPDIRRINLQFLPDMDVYMFRNVFSIKDCCEWICVKYHTGDTNAIQIS